MNNEIPVSASLLEDIITTQYLSVEEEDVNKLKEKSLNVSNIQRNVSGLRTEDLKIIGATCEYPPHRPRQKNFLGKIFFKCLENHPLGVKFTEKHESVINFTS